MAMIVSSKKKRRRVLWIKERVIAKKTGRQKKSGRECCDLAMGWTAMISRVKQKAEANGSDDDDSDKEDDDSNYESYGIAQEQRPAKKIERCS